MSAPRVVIVMPPATAIDPEIVLDQWTTVVRQAGTISASGLDVTVVCRTTNAAAEATRLGVPFLFFDSDRALVRAVRRLAPDVVHIHGLGFSRLTFAIGRAVHRRAAILVQHHGEPCPGRRGVLGHQLARRYVDAYLFTGAARGQVRPFIDRGMIRDDAPCFEVLEAASVLPVTPTDPQPVPLAGTPSLLWVGRLIESKDPLTAVEAFRLAAAELPEAHLHLLATDRTLEADVRAAVDALGPLRAQVHLHPPATLAEMRSWYRSADIFVSTSHREGSGYALIEAITEGCAPVATDLPSHRAILAGLRPTFAAGDAPGAAELIVAAAQNLDREALQVVAACSLSWSNVAEQLRYAYRRTRRSRGLST